MSNDVGKSVGIQNFHTMWCDHNEQRRHYGACCWQVDAYKDGRANPDVDESDSCSNAIKDGKCVAMTMRSEEEAAGHSIYFREKHLVSGGDSAKTIDKNDNYKRGWNRAGPSWKKAVESNYVMPKKTVKKVKMPEESSGVTIKESGYAEALTMAVADQSRKISMADFVAMKKKVMALSKTNVGEAKKLLIEVKRIESNNLITG